MDVHLSWVMQFLSYVYSKQPILGLTQEWLREVCVLLLPLT